MNPIDYLHVSKKAEGINPINYLYASRGDFLGTRKIISINSPENIADRENNWLDIDCLKP